MKSSRFHEIQWISPWNLADFRWNQMFQKSDADVSAKTLLIFLQGLGGFHLKSTGFHEICQISPEIRRISCEIERPLQGIVTLCFPFSLLVTVKIFLTLYIKSSFNWNDASGHRPCPYCSLLRRLIVSIHRSNYYSPIYHKHWSPLYEYIKVHIIY